MSIAPENPAANHPHDDLTAEDRGLKVFICCYCHGHIFEADTEKQAECPQCEQKLPTEELEHWKERVGKTPDQVFENVTRAEVDDE